MIELIAAAIALSIFSFFIGFILSGLFKIDIKVSKKEEYEEKIKMFEGLIADLEAKLSDAQKEPEDNVASYDPSELFPAGFYPEYGIPRKLDEGGN